MAMSRKLFVGLTALITTAAHAGIGVGLGLSSQDLDRLGVTLETPQIVTEMEIASGPAEVAIPPAQQAVVTSTVAGVLSRVLVAEGDFVNAGQSLAEVTSSEMLELQREYIEAALAADLARVQLERDRELFSDGIIAQRRVQESNAAERSATATEDQLRQQLALAGMSRSELDRLLETHELSSAVELRAPFDGFIVDQRSALGARVDALEPVYHLADLSELWLELHVPQERSARIEPGMRVIASREGRTIEGRVRLVGRIANAANQTVLVRASVDNDDLALRPGQFVTARVLGVSTDDGTALAVPTGAIVRINGVAHLFGQHGADMVAVPIVIFGEDGVHTYVQGDLAPGVPIAVSGVAALKSVLVSAEAEGE
jgi:membrane fusion protein, heavy metal efflux system